MALFGYNGQLGISAFATLMPARIPEEAPTELTNSITKSEFTNLSNPISAISVNMPASIIISVERGTTTTTLPFTSGGDIPQDA